MDSTQTQNILIDICHNIALGGRYSIHLIIIKLQVQNVPNVEIYLQINVKYVKTAH